MIVVTGANGFLGRRLVKALKQQNIPVIPATRNKTCKLTNESLELDLTNKQHFDELKTKDFTPNSVIHLAGFIEINLLLNRNLSPPLVPNNHLIYDIYMSNIISTVNLLDYCLEKKVEHLIFASSQAVYGFPKEKFFTEQTPVSPLEHYAQSKVCAEQILQLGSRQGIKITCLRFPGLYGKDKKAGIVHQFCQSAKRDKLINVDIDIPLPFDVIHVDDVVNGIIAATIYNGERYNCFNLSTGKPCNVNLLADEIASLIPGCKVKYSPVKQPIVQMDSTKAYNILKWKSVSNYQRIKEMIEKI